MEVTTRLQGLTELLRAEKTFGARTQGFLTEELHKVGELVAADARSRYAPYSTVGGHGVQTKVFTSGLWVVQTIKKSRDPRRQRPNFGPLMMRKAFLPAARDNESAAVTAATVAVDRARARYWET